VGTYEDELLSPPPTVQPHALTTATRYQSGIRSVVISSVDQRIAMVISGSLWGLMFRYIGKRYLAEHWERLVGELGSGH